MSLVTDERLMAYADGELPPAEARALEIMMAEDPALAARLEPFKVTRTPLASVFNVALAAPVPDRLIAAIKAHPASRTCTPAANARAFSHRVLDWLSLPAQGAGLRLGYALAVSGIVLIGAAAAYTLGQPDTTYLASEAGRMIASKAFAEVLDTKPSQSIAAASGITPVLTFKTAGGLCREYRIAPPAGEHFAGVACRDEATGAWRIATHVEVEKPNAGPPGGYVTAGGDGLKKVDELIDSLIEGDPLGAEDEQRLIAQGWKS